MKVIDIAAELFEDLASPSDTSIVAITFWLRGHVGALSNYIYKNYAVNETTLEILDEDDVEIGIMEVSILKKMYEVYRWDVMIRAKLVSLDSDDLLEVTDEGSSVRKVSKNEVIKSLKDLKSKDSAEFNGLLNSYRINAGAPVQVAGDDTVQGTYPSDDFTAVRSVT
jgi:hypothetical protein|tara:strand:+ start:4793 stop:5293 length:501 start_codon:yes stop_codon:yes gene_type:complete